MHSCIYRGSVRHRRFSPEHGFQYSTSWLYLDLDEVDALIAQRWLLSGRRFSIASYRRQDHFGDESLSMKDAVHAFVLEQTDLKIEGPVRLLTQLRHFGVYFSPINVFYCYDVDENLVAVVGEVSNTPWNERHCYVLWEGNRLPNSKSRYSHSKAFHVSPFMGMDSFYDWRVQAPAERLHLSIGSRRQDEEQKMTRLFHADLNLNRLPLSDAQLLLTLLRRPVAAVQVVGAIYYQALRLWIKKCQYYPHPPESSSLPNQAEAKATMDQKPVIPDPRVPSELEQS